LLHEGVGERKVVRPDQNGLDDVTPCTPQFYHVVWLTGTTGCVSDLMKPQILCQVGGVYSAWNGPICG
jgi:hypothetical protein